MHDPIFHAPTTVSEAIEHLAVDGAHLIGGGTSSAILLKQRLLDPESLVWTGRIAELSHIETSHDGALVLGAGVRLADLAASPAVIAAHPAVARAAACVGNPRIRSVATLGGALAHADPRQDLPPALLVADASVRIVGPSGVRVQRLADGFFQGFLETAIEPEELLTHVLLPVPVAGVEAYVRYTPESLDDYPTVSVAARVERLGGGPPLIRLALGGVDSTVVAIDADELSAVLAAGGADAITEPGEIARAVAAHVGTRVRPGDDQRGSAAYKTAMATVWTERVLRSLL